MTAKHKAQIERHARRIANAEQELIEARKHGNADDVEYAEWRVQKTRRMAEKVAKFLGTLVNLDNEINKLNAEYGR